MHALLCWSTIHIINMVLKESRALTLALFCKVVDNFGDIGICWRLARQLQEEHDIRVSLWVDDLKSFQKICPGLVLNAGIQQLAGVTVHHWRTQDGQFAPSDIADIVIEFFGCDIPPGYIAAMAERVPRSVWINLEGLTAEKWVEGCHTLPSSHPRLPLTKYFFFPGFTDKTGGLLHEASLEEQRREFQSDPVAMTAFLGRLGVRPDEMNALKISLFCYPNAPVAALFEAWKGSDQPVVCLVPEGVATEAVQAFLGAEPRAGTVGTNGALTVNVMPFVPQPDYDKLLWACDLNFVRGEDSFVRAQWAGKPFIWHIYPQDENLHHKKLRAFLERYSPGIQSLSNISLAWNDVEPVDGQEETDWYALWQAFETEMPEIELHSGHWQRQMLANGDLTSNLLKFVRSLESDGAEKKV